MRRATLFRRASLLLLCVLCGGLSAKLAAQATLTGVVVERDGRLPVELASVYLADFSATTQTDVAGRFSLSVPAETEVVIVISRVGFAERRLTLDALGPGQTREIRIDMVPSASLSEDVIVRENKLDEGGAIQQNLDDLRRLPSTTGNLESVLPAIALGVSPGTGGELSSQYNVRGGNYDENLVYVNDFEIYRPQLIRTGQQEGLTFANLDLAQSLSFSSGGFESRYGDKLSSVLAVRYKRPDSLRGSVNASFLGASAHVEGSAALGKDTYRRLRYLVGTRYKTTRYLLNSLDVTGEYVPQFVDLQAYLTYDLTRTLQVGVLLNHNSAKYSFAPESRSTGFGLINQALQLNAALEGGEADVFTTSMGGVSLTYLPERDRNPMFLKLLASGFHIREIEGFDVIGAYSLNEVSGDLASDDFGTPIRSIGEGVQQQYIRNYLYSNVINLTHLGGVELQSDNDDNNTVSHFVQWGLTAKREDIADRINEWERIDSAGFSLPFDREAVLLDEVIKSRSTIENTSLSGFVQDTWTWRAEERVETRLNVGVRAGHTTYNGETYVTPRAQLLIKPLNGKRDISYRLAGGLYYQPPFYRERRKPGGALSEAVVSQKSVHAVAGLTWDYNSKRTGAPFRFIAEAYYKQLADLVSYNVDNVRIRYSGVNDATGYVAGLDMRLNGEFIKGTESWFNVGLLRARESLDGVRHVELTGEVDSLGTFLTRGVNTVPRPTDQVATFSVFFQDYFPGNENLQVNLTTTIGTGLPFGIPDNNTETRNPFRFAPYRRVDVGFAAQLWKSEWRGRKPRHFLRMTEDAYLSLEVFNVLGIRNEASKTWVRTILLRQQYAVPNYLTGRRLNLRVQVGF